MKKVSLCVSILLVLALLAGTAGCALSRAARMPGPEIGSWHAEINMKDLDLTEEDRLLISLLAGTVAYEVDVTFGEDGAFRYVMNMDRFREGLQQSLSTVVGIFLGFDINVFLDRLVDLALDSAGTKNQTETGSYVTDSNGLITAVGGETLYFTLSGGTLYQTNAQGEPLLAFTKTA